MFTIVFTWSLSAFLFFLSFSCFYCCFLYLIFFSSSVFRFNSPFSFSLSVFLSVCFLFVFNLWVSHFGCVCFSFMCRPLLCFYFLLSIGVWACVCFVLRYVIQKNNNLLFYFAVFSFVSLARVRRITNASCAKIVFLSPLLALFVFFCSQIYLLSITQYLFMNEFCFFFFYNSGFCFPHTLLQSFCFNFFPKKKWPAYFLCMFLFGTKIIYAASHIFALFRISWRGLCFFFLLRIQISPTLSFSAITRAHAHRSRCISVKKNWSTMACCYPLRASRLPDK